MTQAGRLLIVEDEPAVSSIVSRSLEREGFLVSVAQTALDALEKVIQVSPDAIILDLMLPDMDGLDLLPKLREVSKSPVIALTARNDWTDRVDGLNRGADDYLTKPFRMEELVARVRALLRRSVSLKSVHEIGDLRIDCTSRIATHRGRRLFLSTTEFQLLELLATNSGTPVSRGQILEQVWDDRARDTNVVEVYINYLRHKLEKEGAPRLISTVRGQGYMLSSPEST